MNHPLKCPSCRKARLVEGTLQSTGSVHFRPASAKFLTFRTADIAMRGAMCPGCGHVTLRGDQEKLRLLLPSLSPNESAQPAGSSF